MRKFILFLILIWVFILTGTVFSRAQSNNLEPSINEQDSTLYVIGFFSKNDTLVYWINESVWKLEPNDTIKTAGISTKVRLTVTDATPKGFKMDYTFLDFKCDSVSESDLGNIQNKLAEKLSKKIIGTTINFETDEYGTITKYNNIGKIKKQAKSLFKESMKELLQLPEIAGLKDSGFDLAKIIKEVDSDKLVDGYLEELKLLFLCHGLVYNIGSTHSHEAASEKSFENDTYTKVELDTTDWSYQISTEVINLIPQKDMKELVEGLVISMDNDTITDSFNQFFDKQVTEDCVYDSYFSSDFISSGWPYRVINQTNITIGNRGKSTQTYIYLDYINY